MRTTLLILIAALGAGVATYLPTGETMTPEPIHPEADARPVILITGSTDGLGREVAMRLAATGAHIIVHGRNEERGRAVVEEIERSTPGTASFHAADLGSLDEVRGLAGAVLEGYDRLDVLINNAGIWARTSDRRELSADGHELSFAVNYLSHFLLTELLRPRIEASAPARIINVASVAQTPIDLDDVMMERGYDGSRAYGQSKLAQILHAFDLAPELEPRGVAIVALHPATLMDTEMVRGAGARPRATVAEGAEAVVRLVQDPNLGTGLYFDGLRETRAHAQAYDAEARRRLREISLELVAR